MILRDYQKKGASFLYAKKKALLIMGCRTGKTATALAASDLTKLPVYIVGAPLTQKIWETECIFLCKHRRFISPFKKGNHRIPNKCVLIIDECQLYMHDWEKHKTIIRMALKAEYCFMLTATPLTNDPINLYWPLKICGEVFSKDKYKLRYMGGKKHRSRPFIYPTEPTNIMELKKIKEKHSFIFFRKESVISKRFNLGKCPLKAPDEIEDYSSAQKALSILKVDDILKDSNFMDLVSSGGLSVVYFRHILAGKRLFLACKNLCNVSGLSYKRKRNFFYIDGSVPFNKRLEIIDKFQSLNNATLFLNVDSSGIGIDIQKPDNVIFFERTWSGFKDYQAYMRCYGFKPKETLFVYYFDYENEARYNVVQKKEILKSI